MCSFPPPLARWEETADAAARGIEEITVENTGLEEGKKEMRHKQSPQSLSHPNSLERKDVKGPPEDVAPLLVQEFAKLDGEEERDAIPTFHDSKDHRSTPTLRDGAVHPAPKTRRQQTSLKIRRADAHLLIKGLKLRKG